MAQSASSPRAKRAAGSERVSAGGGSRDWNQAPDSEIDFSGNPELTDEDLSSGRWVTAAEHVESIRAAGRKSNGTPNLPPADAFWFSLPVDKRTYDWFSDRAEGWKEAVGRALAEYMAAHAED